MNYDLSFPTPSSSSIPVVLMYLPPGKCPAFLISSSEPQCTPVGGQSLGYGGADCFCRLQPYGLSAGSRGSSSTPLCLGSGDAPRGLRSPQEPANIYRQRKVCSAQRPYRVQSRTVDNYHSFCVFCAGVSKKPYLFSPLQAFCCTQNSSLLTNHGILSHHPSKD